MAAQSAELKRLVKTAKVYELQSKTGEEYVFFFFNDKSVCAAKKVLTAKGTLVKLEFRIKTKQADRECGVQLHGTTYQKGQELLKNLEA